jgi:hypothetical protein
MARIPDAVAARGHRSARVAPMVVAAGLFIGGVAVLGPAQRPPAPGVVGVTTASGSPLASASSSDPTAAPMPAAQPTIEPTVKPPSPTPSPAPKDPPTLPEDLVATQAGAGTHLTPPDGSVAITDADLSAAIGVARSNFGSAGKAVAFPATVTVDGYHLGDENSPLAVDHRQVIVVQVTGVQMPSIGGGYGDTAPASVFGELVVYVDATTGAFLLASNVR